MVFQPPSRYQYRILPLWVRPVKEPPFPLLKPHGRRARLGVKYEWKVHDRLREEYGLNYWCGLWLSYFAGERVRYCQLDGLLLLPEKRQLVVVEVKYSHCTEAYWQLENLYLPIVRCWMKNSKLQIATAEVVKWYDPAVVYPRKPTLVEELELCRPDKFSVMILNR